MVLLLLAGLIVSRVISPDTQSAEIDYFQEPDIRIQASDAIEHLGAYAEVCGEISETRYLPDLDGKPTFLNLERDYPDQLFTVVIWERNYDQWHAEPFLLFRSGLPICIKGIIQEHNGTPQIEVSRAWQIRVQ